jgi:hypothetical protein
MKFIKFFLRLIFYLFTAYKTYYSMHIREDDILVQFSTKGDKNPSIFLKQKTEMLKSKVRGRMNMLKKIANGKLILNQSKAH